MSLLHPKKKPADKPDADTAAGQEADRAKAALRNTRKGYGHDRSTQDLDKAGTEPEDDTAGDVARRHGEHDR